MVEKKVLENGLELVLDKTYDNSVTLAAVIKFGSKDEPKKYNGIAHFLEHIVFSGPKNLSKSAISKRIDKIGGEINAFTSENQTGFYVQVLPKYFSIALKTIKQIVYDAYIKSFEVEEERRIILNEVRQHKDSPHSFVTDLVKEQLYPNNSIGRMICGTEKSVKKISTKALKEFFKKEYIPNNMVVYLSGKFDEKDVEKLTREFLQKKKSKLKKKVEKASDKIIKSKKLNREWHQAHIGFGIKLKNILKKEKYAMHLIDAVLTGGLSSRLYQEIREKSGLAYIVQSYADFSLKDAYYIIYVGTSKEKVSKVNEILIREFNKLVIKELSVTQLKDSKNYIEGHTILESNDSLDRTSLNMELMLEGHKSVEDFLENVKNLSSKFVQKTAKKFFNEKNYVSLIVEPKEK